MDSVIILRNIQLQGANAIAGLTWGFPSITHFLGYTHALQRNLPKELSIKLNGCAVICHEHKTQTYQACEYADHTFTLARNPLDKSGKSSSIVEEGKINLKLSLVIALDDQDGMDEYEIGILKKYLTIQAQKQHLAGGIIVNEPEVEFYRKGYLLENHKRVMRGLLPGYVLVNRHGLLQLRQSEYKEQGMQDPEFRAWLSFASLNYHAKQEEDGSKVSWEREERSGWLVPITVGYRPISQVYEPGDVAKARDPETPFCFVENLYSLGQWISPHRITSIEQLFWRYHHNDAGDYLCVNNFEPKQEQINITA